MILNVMKVKLLKTYKVDSINFKNAVIKSTTTELSEYPKDIKEMIIESRFGNDYFGHLIIENYPNLQSIIVKKSSLQNLNSLKICNCQQLKTIEVEDGDRWEEKGKWYANGAFWNVKNVIIESIGLFGVDIYIFLIYNHSKQEKNHSIKQQVYLCQVEYSNSILAYIFLNYNHSKQDIEH